MKGALILGILLVAIGATFVGYDHYTYTTREQVLQIGPLTATAEKKIPSHCRPRSGGC